MKLFFDLDGVLVDFVKGVCDTLNYQYEDVYNNWKSNIYISDELGIHKGKLWGKIDNVNGWWANLQPYSWTDRLLKETNRYEQFILTAPHQTSDCFAGKYDWVRKHTKLSKNVIITSHKYLCAAPDRILIDDNDKKTQDFQKSGGKIILFPQPWNENRQLHFDKIDKVQFVIDSILKLESE